VAELAAFCSAAGWDNRGVGDGEATVGVPEDAVKVEVLVVNVADVVDCVG
jgi:hypothetical protein